MLSERSFSRATRRILEHMASIVPAIMQNRPQPSPTIVLTRLGRRHTRSRLDSFVPKSTHNQPSLIFTSDCLPYCSRRIDVYTYIYIYIYVRVPYPHSTSQRTFFFVFNDLFTQCALTHPRNRDKYKYSLRCECVMF